MHASRYSIGLAALLWAAPVFADEIRGTLLRLSPEKQEMVVDVRGRGRRITSYTFRLDGDTQVQLGHKPGNLGDLKVGKRVRVLFEVQNGQALARMITGPAVITLNPALLETLGQLGAANGLNLGNLLGGAMKPGNPGVPPPPPVPAPMAVPPAAGQASVSGMMRRVSRTDREIVILGDPAPGKPPAENTVFVPNEAQITRDQKPISFDDLREGEAATVVAQPKNGRLEAQAVIIGQPAAGGIPAPAAPVQQGAPIPPPPPPMQGESKISKIREALRVLDGILEQFDQSGPPRP
jgi:hypothetical protein